MSIKRYAVTVRNQYGLMSEVVVEAGNTFLAQKAALALHPYSRVVRIAPAEPDFNGEDW